MCSTSNTSFISALTQTIAGNQLSVCVFSVCVYTVCVCFEAKSMPEKKIQRLYCFLTLSSSSLQPGQLITSLHHWLFLHNNKNAINIYGNTVWKQEATPSLMPTVCTRVCVSVRVCLSVCFCMHARCLHSDFVFRGNCSLWCSLMQATADTPISLHRADASYASASPQKLVHFNVKWSKIEINYIQLQPGDVSTKRQNHTLFRKIRLWN